MEFFKSLLKKVLSPVCAGTLLGAILLLSGCKTLTQLREERPRGPEYAIYYGVGGQEANWYTLQVRAQLADVVLIGEQHDNALAHAMELKIVEAVLGEYPDSAVAMEMFERDEQSLVDAYLSGDTSAATLYEVTESKSWGGSEEVWRAWYLPVVDAAKGKHKSGARVIAANAPRKYAVVARKEGFEALQVLGDTDEAAHFVLPNHEVDDAAYEDRFHALMSGGHGHGGHGEPIDPVPYFRAQQVWDATMADSVLGATETHPKVILLVGDFHIADEGGLYQRIRHDDPKRDILTVSIVRKRDTATWDPADLDRADFVIYTREGTDTLSHDVAHSRAGSTTNDESWYALKLSPLRRNTGPRSK